MPRYRFVPNGRGRVAWTESVSKGRVLHYAKWHDATFERVGGGPRQRRHRRSGYRPPQIPMMSGGAQGLGGLELAALVLSLGRRLRRHTYTGPAR